MKNSRTLIPNGLFIRLQFEDLKRIYDMIIFNTLYKCILCCFLLISSANLQATPQIPDKIEIDGISYPLCTPLLYSELSEAKHDEILTEISKMTSNIDIVISTALRRCHICLWKIKNNELFFEGMSIPQRVINGTQERYYTLKNLNVEIQGLDQITWKYSYTGKLIVATGKSIGINRYSTFGNVYSTYSVLEVIDGHIKHIENAYNPNPSPNKMIHIQMKNPQKSSFRIWFCNPERFDIELQFPQGIIDNSNNGALKIRAFDAIPVIFNMQVIQQMDKKMINMKWDRYKNIEIRFY